MAHKRRARVRYHSVRGGHTGYFGSRYQGFPMTVRVRRYKRSARSRRNPFLGNPGKGGTNWLLVGGVAVGAFFLLRGGGLSNLFGSSAPPGYTQLGTSSYYRGPDGQLYTRTATGGMMLSPTQATAGSTLEQQLIMQGSRLAVPLITGGVSALSNWLGNLFSGGSSTGAIPTESGATTVTAPDVLSGAYSSGGLAPLPDIPDLQLSGDWFSAPSTDWWTQPVQSTEGFTWEAPYSLGVPSLELSLAPLPPIESYDYGYMGLRGLGRLYFQARPGGYGLARRSPSGEMEARFLRQPPSYR